MTRDQYHALRSQSFEPQRERARELLRRGGKSVKEIAAQRDVNLSYSTVFKLAHAIDCVPHKERKVTPRARKNVKGARPYKHHNEVKRQYTYMINTAVGDQQTREAAAKHEAQRVRQVELELKALNNPYLRGVRSNKK